MLSALVYFGFKKEKVFGFSFGPGFNFLKELVPSSPKDYNQNFNSFKDSVSEKGKGAVSFLKNEIGESFNKTIDKSKSLIDQTVSKAKGTIFGVVEESLNKTENIAGEILGVKSNSAADGSDLLTESIAYLTKINTPLSFVIKNLSARSGKDMRYRINWGDGKQTEGELLSGQNIVISHAWSEEGEYLVKFKITADSNIFDYQIKVLVVK